MNKRLERMGLIREHFKKGFGAELRKEYLEFSDEEFNKAFNEAIEKEERAIKERIRKCLNDEHGFISEVKDNEFKCPHCKAKFKIGAIGHNTPKLKTIFCPYCASEFEVDNLYEFKDGEI